MDNDNIQRPQNMITGRQIGTVLISSTGFFMDAYDIFVINLVLPMLNYVYYNPSNTTMPSDIQGVVKGMTNVGNLFGQVLFGILADTKGRTSVYGIELLIIIVATIGCALVGSAKTHTTSILGFLGFWRFILGIGIGGDYPMSATVSSEWSSAGRRGSMLALTFSMQGWGQLAGALFDLILLAIFKQSIESDPENIDFVWRILFVLGIVPAICTVYSRFRLPESARYAEHVLQNSELAQKGRAYALGQDDVVSNTSSSSSPAINQTKSLNDRNHMKDFISYFSQWCNFKVLLGTCSTWFLLDIAFYGLSLNQSVVLSAIGFAPDSKTSPWETLWKQGLGNLIIILLGSLPGYYVTVFTIERLGRKPIQILGFTMEVILFTIVAVAYDKLKEQAIAVFIILFALIQFFFQFGANATTFIIPAEVFPTRFRATAHGISAACGKAGAILAAFGFNVIVDIGGKNKFLRQTLGIFAGIQFIGLVATIWLIPESKGRDLDHFEDLEYQRQQQSEVFTIANSNDEQDYSSS